MGQFWDSWYSYQFRYCSVNNSGLVISEWEIPHDKMRVKKYYSITQKGKDELKELIVFWNLLSTKVQDFLLEDNEYEE